MISGLILMVSYLYLVISNQVLWSIPFTLMLVVIYTKRLILKHSSLENNRVYTFIVDILVGFIFIVIYIVFRGL